ncbi:Zinc finger C2HC5-type [Arabidopsis thaliana x Arabidopsis arenosa]|uniref:Zinc finger C2HC5-type n=1 Tax=Arabidopsis thaliana x Arabidopsis arenosa TaxID=1240361 RepID=A0A8T1ZLI1_9BRAS|nr:Zinc finger C2HC5-type [Arabidopsis thaliana x Arabidopsis arenosa]
MGTAVGQWLEEALVDLCRKPETGLNFDRDVISGLVSYCDLAQPVDAKEYLDNIIGKEGKTIIAEYLQRRGYKDPSSHVANSSGPELQMYVKPKVDNGASSGTKKPFKTPKEGTSSNQQAGTGKVTAPTQQVNPKKKKGGKVISLAEAAKGSIVFQQGKPCACQARRHKLVSNCLSCGKIVCEQEGEGPCSFCGALVLKEGSTYAGLEEGYTPVSDADVAAEAYAKRLVEYDRNSAARTTVIDDQSDYYESESSIWLSAEEKELVRKKREEIEEAERLKKSKVVMTFDLVGRKVLLNEDDISELESGNRILGPPETKNVNRIKPNPTAKLVPIFLDPGPTQKKPNSTTTKKDNKKNRNGLCLEITGRVQHDRSELKYLQADPKSDGKSWPSGNDGLHVEDGGECSLDYD